MKTIKFVPGSFAEEGVFSGYLILAKPSIDDVFEGTALAKSFEDDLQRVKAVIEWSKKFYVEVHVKCVDESEYKTFDDLRADGECLGLMSEVAHALMAGLNAKKSMTKAKKEK